MVRALARLGLAERLPEFAVRLDAAWEFRNWKDGRVLFVQPMGEACERLYGAHCYVAHRADLMALLQQALPPGCLRLDARCVEVRQNETDAELVLAGRNGDTFTVTADVVIGADGIHSAVRPFVAPEVDARFSGLCAFRCLVPAERAPAMALRPVQTLWLGPGRHFVHYPVSGGRLVNVVAIVPAGDWRDESWTSDGDVAELREEFEGWDDRLQQLIRSARPDQALGDVRPHAARALERGPRQPARRRGPRDAAVLRAGRGAGAGGRVRAGRVPAATPIRPRPRRRSRATRRSAGRARATSSR